MPPTHTPLLFGPRPVGLRPETVVVPFLDYCQAAAGLPVCAPTPRVPQNNYLRIVVIGPTYFTEFHLSGSSRPSKGQALICMSVQTGKPTCFAAVNIVDQAQRIHILSLHDTLDACLTASAQQTKRLFQATPHYLEVPTPISAADFDHNYRQRHPIRFRTSSR